MDQDYNHKFEQLTEGLKTEQLIEALNVRAEIARTVAIHVGSLKKTARSAGLSRKAAEKVAMDYWNYEMKPGATTTYIIDGEVEGL
jgi:hypothetical protein